MASLIAAPLVAGCTGYGPPGHDGWRLFLGGDRPAATAEGLLSPDAVERRWSIILLARQGDPNAADALIVLLDKSNEPVSLVRATACVGLRELGDKRAVQPLVSLFDPISRRYDPASLVRADAAHSVGDLGGPDEIDPLARALMRDPDSTVRLEAAMAVGRIGGKNAVPVLVNSLNDMNESVAFAAHSGLISITGQNLPPEPKQWQTWMEKKGK